MNYEEWLQEAIRIIDAQLKEGKAFEVKSLFSGHKWNELTSGQKRYFGVYFSNAVTSGRINNVQQITENKAHHKQYIKIGTPK